MKLFSSHKNTNIQDQVFKEYYSRLCDYASRFTNSFEEAEDVVQDVFVVYLGEWKTIKQHPASIKSFLYSAVKFTCLNKIRREKIGERVNEEIYSRLENEGYMLETMILSEVIGELHQALKILPKGCEEVVRLGYLEGLKNSQIADELGISLNTVKSQKQRALMLLRKRLTPESFIIIFAILLK